MKTKFTSLLATAFCIVSMLFNVQEVNAQNALTTFGISGTTAASAYSLRKLSTSYTGSAIQVRRSNDNNTSNIGFTANGDLDTATLKTFVGSNSAFVTIWYDQSGNARDLTQTTTSKQPAVISAGIIFRRNEKPTLFFDGTDDGMGFSGSNYLTTNPLTVNLVAGSNSNTSGFRRAVQGYNNWLIGPYDGTHSWYAGGWNHQSSKVWLTNAIEYFTVTQPSSGYGFSYRNGTQLSSGSSFYRDVPNKLGLGTEGSFAEPLNGFISEVVSYPTDLSSTNRQLMENSQKVYYPTTDNALRFDGTNDFVNIPDNSTLDLTSNYTLEAWVNISTPTASAGIISKYQTSASNGYFLRLSGTSPNRGLDFDGLTTTSHTLLEPGKWYHIAAVKSGSARALYINGVLQTLTGSVITTAANADPIKIGSDFNSRYFNGSIDEVRIWNTARTQAEIQARMNTEIPINTTGLLATYNFKQGIAAANNTGIATLVDEKSGFNGTLNNFALSGSTSNWVESYAMVVPTATAAVITSATSLTANWTAPLTGTVTNYLLDVSTSSTFSSFVSGYNALSVSGTSQAITGLTNGATYYYRVRANKTSVTGQGGYSNTISAIPQASSNANLTNILTTAGSYSPAFSLNTTSYIATGVSNATTFITVTPYSEQVNATIQVRVNGGSYSTVTSGTASSALNLNVGNNTVDIRVTAQDGTTTKTYTLIVPRFGNMLNNAGISNDYINSPAAFGLRKLSAAYVGNAIQVRRSSDHATADIGFTTNGDLDTAALKTFVGANNGFVNIWYDQSGFARNATTESNVLASQPQIVNAGVIFRKNAKPTVYFDRTWLATPNFIGYSTTFELAIIAGVQNNTSSPTFGGKTTNNIPGPWDMWGTNFYFGNGSAYSWATLTNGINAASGFSQWSFNASSSGGNARRNSSANGSYNVASYGDVNNALYLGTRGDGGTNLIGWISEYITLSTTLNSIEKLAVETNQLNYFNISNNNLSALAISGGSLSPNFATNTTTYNVSVINSTTSITVTPVVEYEGASLSISVNGGAYAALASGTQSSSLPLNLGANIVELRVLAVDGTSIKTYTINVTREPTPLTTLGITTTYAASAYSLRKLTSEYTGNAIQVRRSSDNATQNIGFTVAGDLDTTALKTFVGNNNGFISIWYDQSGFGRNAVQAAAGSQPQIINSGVVYRKNGMPTIYFNEQSLATSSFTAYSAGFTIALCGGVNSNAVSTGYSTFGAKTSSSNIPQPWDGWGASFGSYAYQGNGSNYDFYGLIKPIQESSGFSQWVFQSNTTNANGYINSVANGSTTSSNYGDFNNSLYLGTRSDGFTKLNGWISEYVTFPSALNNTDRQVVENNQMFFHGINNANLNNLITSVSTLSPSFAANTTSYTSNVSNSITGITITPTVEIEGATIQVRINGGSYATVVSGAASSSLNLNVGSNTVDVRVTAQDGTTTKTYTITVTREPLLYTWIGANNNVWNLASNWSPAVIPASNANVIIGNSNNDPVLGSNTIVNDLTLNDTLVIGNTTLTINGAVSGSSVLRGASNSNLTITGTSGTIRFDQNSLGNTNVLRNLTISGSGTTVLGNTLNITGGSSSGIVTVGSGATLNTGGNLVLKSNATGTASIGSSVGTISGNVTVERFIPRRRAFRFLSSPVNTSNFISNNWQQATHITGSLTGQNGFDQSNSGTASLFTYNAGTEAWAAIPNTNATNLNIGTGYRMLIRGDRNINLNSTSPQDSAMLVLSATGSIVTGNVVFGGGSVSSSPAGIPALNAAVGSGNNNSTIGWSLIGNPYASAVNWTEVTKSNVSNTFATWNVNNAGRGSYVYHNGSAGTGFGASNIINSGQAVFVQTIGANPSITFTEASKVTSAPPSHFKKSLSDVLNIDIFIGDRAYDALTVLFDEENNNEYDVNDFIKLVNPEINFYSYLADGTKLAMNNMKEVGEETIVPLGLNGVFNGGSYELKFSNQNTFSNAEVKLKDKFINKIYDLKSINNLVFTVTADSNSFGENRFELIFSKSATGLNNELTSTNNFIVFPNPANNVLNLSLTTTKEDNYNYSIFNQLGAEVSNGNLDFNSKRTHALNIENLNSGVYFIQVKNGKSTQTIKFIK